MKKYVLAATFALMLPLAICAVSDGGDYYPVVFDKNQNYTHASRRLNSVSLNSPADGVQTLRLPVPLKVYSLVVDGCFTAMPGERVVPSFGFSGTWMNGFVYIDRGQDGSFEATLNSDGSIPVGSDIMAFSYAEPVLGGAGYNSDGERVTNANVLNPPAFTIPVDMAPGFYRMRYKVDWASIDPAGRTEDGNGILKNGGAVCDVRLNVHAKTGMLDVVAENGSLLSADGTVLPATVVFGKPLVMKVVPATGYVLDCVSVVHGHNLNGEEFVCGVQQYAVESYPGYLVKDGLLTVPAEYVDGDVRIVASFVKQDGGSGGEGYALSFDKDATASNVTNEITLNNATFAVDGNRAYYDFTGTPVAMYGTRRVNVSFENAVGKNSYLYIDFNNDGRFSAVIADDGKPTVSSELVALDGELSCNIPDVLSDGVYRARVKVDTDNINPDGSEKIVVEGGFVVDFLLNVLNGNKKLDISTVNGSIDGVGNTALPMTVVPLQAFDVVLRGAPGFAANGVVVRHGHNLDGEQFVNGNCQWREERVGVVDGKAVVAAEWVDGEVALYADFLPEENGEWSLVFSDEFNAPDYSQPLKEKWMRCQRYGSTWNRWLSDSEEVIYLQGGDLVARAIPNPDKENDPVDMITGGIKTNGRFGFTYGYIEARIFTDSWKGHFPAFWMMPEDQSAGWPDCGEIDIWETIDNQSTSYHTVHSNWTYDLKQTNNPKSSHNATVVYDRYHTFGLMWDETSLTWYVDGKQVGNYKKSANKSYLDQGQWPFDKHFHIILNQSVGNRSWADNPDIDHTYETRFDWVRVYQKDGMENTYGTVGVSSVVAENNVAVNAVDGALVVASDIPTDVTVYDLAGRKVASAVVYGVHRFPLNSGVYVVCGKKILVK